MTRGRVPGHARILYCEYEETGREYVPPPNSCTFMVEPDALVPVRRSLEKLNESRGWNGEIFERCLFREDMEEGDG